MSASVVSRITEPYQKLNEQREQEASRSSNNAEYQHVLRLVGKEGCPKKGDSDRGKDAEEYGKRPPYGASQSQEAFAKIEGENGERRADARHGECNPTFHSISPAGLDNRRMAELPGAFNGARQGGPAPMTALDQFFLTSLAILAIAYFAWRIITDPVGLDDTGTHE